MKTSFLLAVIALIPSVVAGQAGNNEPLSSGTLTFEEVIKLEINLEGNAAQFADMLPKERRSMKVLHFSQDATLFEEIKSVDDDMMMEQGEGIRIKMMGNSENKLYTDLKNSKILEQRDFMNRMFLVEKELPRKNWKITGNQKVILGYPCMEATTQDTAGIVTTVWFAPLLNIKGGPGEFSNLPGMVLEANVNNGSRTYIAKSIEPRTMAELDLQRPKEGKKVTGEEFQAIVAEKMAEMGVEGDQSGSGGTQMRVIIRK